MLRCCSMMPRRGCTSDPFRYNALCVSYLNHVGRLVSRMNADRLQIQDGDRRVHTVKSLATGVGELPKDWSVITFTNEVSCLWQRDTDQVKEVQEEWVQADGIWWTGRQRHRVQAFQHDLIDRMRSVCVQRHFQSKI